MVNSDYRETWNWILNASCLRYGLQRVYLHFIQYSFQPIQIKSYICFKTTENTSMSSYIWRIQFFWPGTMKGEAEVCLMSILYNSGIVFQSHTDLTKINGTHYLRCLEKIHLFLRPGIKIHPRCSKYIFQAWTISVSCSNIYRIHKVNETQPFMKRRFWIIKRELKPDVTRVIDHTEGVGLFICTIFTNIITLNYDVPYTFTILL